MDDVQKQYMTLGPTFGHNSTPNGPFLDLDTDFKSSRRDLATADGIRRFKAILKIQKIPEFLRFFQISQQD